MANYAAAAHDALKAAAAVISDALKRHSPSAKIDAAWHTTSAGDRFYVRNELVEARETALNLRHPIYAKGPRTEWSWAAENQNNPGRTGWHLRALDEAEGQAGDDFVAEYVHRVALSSRIFNEE